MRDGVPSASYSSVCNVLRQWNISLIPTYESTDSMIHTVSLFCFCYFVNTLYLHLFYFLAGIMITTLQSGFVKCFCTSFHHFNNNYCKIWILTILKYTEKFVLFQMSLSLSFLFLLSPFSSHFFLFFPSGL